MRVHVSIHDVSPAFAAELDDALAACAAVRARPALLVVPDFHGRWPLGAHPEFCARLRRLQEAGHEIFLHGFFHKARTGDAARDAGLPPRKGTTGRPGRLRSAFAQRVASGGEAEFSDLSREEAVERLARGEQVLAEAGLRVDGFVPPAWSMERWLLPLLAGRGYRYCEDHGRVYDPAGQTARASVVLNFATRTPGRLVSSVAWCRIARYAGGVLPARIAIHPADLRVGVVRREVASLLAWGSRGRMVAGRELVA
jgi:predicted deacetylase